VLERRTRHLQADLSSLQNTVRAQVGPAETIATEISEKQEQIQNAEEQLRGTDQTIRKIAKRIVRVELQEKLLEEREMEDGARNAVLQELNQEKSRLSNSIPQDQQSHLADVRKLILRQTNSWKEQDPRFTNTFAPQQSSTRPIHYSCTIPC